MSPNRRRYVVSTIFLATSRFESTKRVIAAFISRPTSFKPSVEGIAFVGSSNLSAPALTSSIEWNYKVISRHERAGFSEITAGFENIFNAYQAVRADEAWIRRYEARRVPAGLAEQQK